MNKHRTNIVSDSDNVYYDVNISSNNEQSKSTSNYNVTRTQNILDDPSDYFLSVIRFTIPSYFVPILEFVPQVEGGNNGQYSVTLQRGGQIQQVFVTYVNDSVETYAENPKEYYYMYQYQSFVNLINTALDGAFAALGGNIPVGSAAPVMLFDSPSKTFTMYFDETYIGANPILVYFNDKLWSLIYGMQHERQNTGIGFTADGRDVLLLVDNYGNNFVDTTFFPLNPPQLYYFLTQEYSTVYNWNPYKRIVLTTGNLPIENEFVKGEENGYRKILTDFSPSNNVNDERSVYQYFPTSQYRLIDMISNTNLKKINLQVWWQDRNEDLRPIYLPWNSQINIKLGFFNKNLYNSKA